MHEVRSCMPRMGAGESNELSRKLIPMQSAPGSGANTKTPVENNKKIELQLKNKQVQIQGMIKQSMNDYFMSNDIKNGMGVLMNKEFRKWLLKDCLRSHHIKKNNKAKGISEVRRESLCKLS